MNFITDKLEEISWGAALGSDSQALPAFARGRLDNFQWSQVEHPKKGAVGLFFLLSSQVTGPAKIVLTRRTLTVRTHKGQIGFAGGRAEREDQTPIDTAKRELSEELGVGVEHIDDHGLYRSVLSLDGAPVYPVILSARAENVNLTPQIEEVAEIYQTAWTSFTRKNDRPFKFNIFGNWRHSNFFTAGEYNVWGLSARILFNLDLQ